MCLSPLAPCGVRVVDGALRVCSDRCAMVSLGWPGLAETAVETAAARARQRASVERGRRARALRFHEMQSGRRARGLRCAA